MSKETRQKLNLDVKFESDYGDKKQVNKTLREKLDKTLKNQKAEQAKHKEMVDIVVDTDLIKEITASLENKITHRIENGECDIKDIKQNDVSQHIQHLKRQLRKNNLAAKVCINLFSLCVYNNYE